MINKRAIYEPESADTLPYCCSLDIDTKFILIHVKIGKWGDE